MKRTVLMVLVIIGMTLLGGCLSMNDENGDDQNEQTDDSSYENSDRYVSVQEYTGEGYTLANGKENDRIANDNREVIEEAVKDFFQEEYKTEVSVHQIVGNKDGATVFVESVGEPHFYTYAVIPINQATKEIVTEGVFTQEGQVENAIMAGVYGMVFEEEFNNLTNLIQEVASKHKLVGKNSEIMSLGANRFSNEYYSVTIFNSDTSDVFQRVIKEYLDESNKNYEEWTQLVKKEEIDPQNVAISIKLFMRQKQIDPSPNALKELKETLKDNDNIPTGAYNIYIHDNLIDKITATGDKENSIEWAFPNELIKK
ncbi:lipoprotein [Gracilibacillus halophilus YIM-C55.5]|uniref:Lipoprotein n=1 Tax=Gracilibacillus halophilus YIM-C55.5 TaxID=1308866 RepID=N4WEP4_9BACI|nr:DUF1672 family protein [Gracilibacillus halophilus]ENH97729.1 lipoprotein [Gracilibacillus halophilus YIM-C55.5]